jgi:hypothetical protein
MILEYGDMWKMYGKTPLWCFTGNSYIRKDGCLVMGRGLAKEVRDRVQGSDEIFGGLISISHGHLGEYGLLVHVFPSQLLGLFQVKKHFRDKADLDLIAHSVESLLLLLHTVERIDLNYPGIGFGGLEEEDVRPIIERLPDNVHVWRHKDARSLL